MENMMTSIPVSHYTDFPKTSVIDQQLNSCQSLKQLKQIHSYLIRTSLQKNPQQQYLYTRIISSIATTANDTPDITYIHTLFTKLENPNIHLYNTLIKTFPALALLFFSYMLKKGLLGDSFTYPFVLKACALLRALKHGQQIHCHVVKNGYVLDLYVVNMLVRFYSECGAMECAKKVFSGSDVKDLVTWTTLIQGYVKTGCCEKGVELFDELCEVGVKADEITMVVLISACGQLRDLSLGKRLHKYICDNDLDFDVYVCNALIDMYMKCGGASLAVEVFNEMPIKNVVSWNSMIMGLVQQGEFTIALNMFIKMQNQGVKPDDVTLVGVLNCCANLGTLKTGKWVHSYIDGHGITADGFIGNALLDMYMKCGVIEKAYCVFNGMKHRDVFTYTSMIVGLAMNGKGLRAPDVFSEMLKTGIVPNDVTYLGILMACSHAGLVKEGCKHFVDMLKVHNIKPQKEHYGCMVDLLGRAGLLSEAEDIIEHMVIEPDALAWGALLAACRIHGNVEIGKRVMKKLDKMDAEKDCGAYILMSNLYSFSYRWGDAFKLRKTMKERNIKKSPGCSSVEVDGVAYEFRKGDKSHIKAKEIYMLLDIMEKHLKNSEHIIA